MDGVSIRTLSRIAESYRRHTSLSRCGKKNSKFKQSNFSAEYGFSGSTIVNLVTPLWNEPVHGSLYEFLRNDKLDANSWFSITTVRPDGRLRQKISGYRGRAHSKEQNVFSSTTMALAPERFDPQVTGGHRCGKTGRFRELCTLRGASFDANGLCSDPSGSLDPFNGASFDRLTRCDSHHIHQEQQPAHWRLE